MRRFHDRHGCMVTLSDSNRVAERNEAHREFNHGLVLSSHPLVPDELFEVKIEKKISTWAGSIEIGLTTLDPSVMDFPATATNLLNESWVMSGSHILRDGKPIYDECAGDLDELNKGDTVGVMKSFSGTIHFFINGVDQCCDEQLETESQLYAVVDLYGKCCKVSIVNFNDVPIPTALIPDQEQEMEKLASMMALNDDFIDPLTFHPHCGSMVILSSDNRVAERCKPLDGFNNGVVMTHRPLLNNELFQIQIVELIQKWSGSIEMGVSTHNPDTLDFPKTMTNMHSGTIMLSGHSVLTNGKSNETEYGEFDLDELRVGDRIGLMRKGNANLHYYINGRDQGKAASNIPLVVYGVIDLYGMTVKVCIDENTTSNGPTVRGTQILSSKNYSEILEATVDPLLFNERCGNHVSVIHNGRTAVRSNCFDDYDHAVVMTNRPLKPDEFFQVIIEQVVTGWVGSIRIGVTTHDPNELRFPAIVTNIKTGMWIMAGNVILQNGTTTIDFYGHDLDKLKAGDRVGLVLKNGKLNFFVNGVDQGLAAYDVPDEVYGVIDLYGPAVKASIVPHSIGALESGSSLDNDSSFRNQNQVIIAERPNLLPLSKVAVGLNNEGYKSGNVRKEKNNVLLYNGDVHSPFEEGPCDPLFLFHEVAGQNIQFKSHGNMAIRTSSYEHGVVFSSKRLEEEGSFEIQIMATNSEWGGSFTIGLTDLEPQNEIVLPSSAMQIQGRDSWLLCGNEFYVNGSLVIGSYPFSMPKPGDRFGLRKDKSGNLYFTFNGKELGTAARNVPPNLYIICDVFGVVEAIQITQSVLPLTPILEVSFLHSQHLEKTDGGKANLKNGIKESDMSKPPSCEFEAACSQIKSILYPDAFFLPEKVTCFCNRCHQHRVKFSKGDLPKEYAQPFGWCCFELKNFYPERNTNSWNIAFHGTKIIDARKMLDHKGLLPKEKLDSKLISTSENCGSERAMKSSPIIVSPILKCAGDPQFAPKCKIIDPKTKKPVYFQLAFQVLVRPNSYSVVPVDDSYFLWFTKEQESTALHGLLIKLVNI